METKKYGVVKNPDGSYNVVVKKGEFNNIPYAGMFKSTYEMDASIDEMFKKYPDGYVCHIGDGDNKTFLFISPVTLGTH